MKPYLTLLLLICLTQLAIGQTKADARLLEIYSAEDLQNWEKDAPQMIDSLNFALENLYVLIDAPKPGDDLQKVKVSDLEHINILKLIQTYQLKREKEHNMYYPVEGTDKWILMMPGYLYEQRYQAYKAAQK